MSAAEIARALGGAARSGGGWLARCPVADHGQGRGDRSPSLSLRDGDQDVIVHCHAGCDPRHILAALRQQGLLCDRRGDGRNPAGRRRRLGTGAGSNKNGDVQVRRARAIEIWQSALESIMETPAEAYLLGRGLDPQKLVSLRGSGCWPATLRYSERAALDPARACRALVVAVHGADCGLVRAVHRVLLNADGSPVRDDRGRKRKLSLGPIAGNAARFDYSPDPAGRWGLAEGCESALAAYALTGITTWAAISAGNMANINPPSWARRVTIFADRDTPGMRAAGEALHRLRELPQIATSRVVAAVAQGGDAADVLAAGGL